MAATPTPTPTMTPTPVPTPTPTSTPATTNNTTSITIWRSCLSLLLDSSARDEPKFEAATQLSEDLEHIVENYQIFDQTITTFITYLETTRPQFVSENPRQKLRKLLLEMIHRVPIHDVIKLHVNKILKLMFSLYDVENEENVATMLRIIIDLHKTYKPSFIEEIYPFIESIKTHYKEFRKNFDLNTMFDERKIIVSEFNDRIVESLLSSLHRTTVIELETNSQQIPGEQAAGTNSSTARQVTSYNILPVAKLSLKVIAEISFVVVFLYQQHKPQLNQSVAEFIPLIIDVISIKPPDKVKMANSEQIDREIYVEFITAQIKSLAFIAYVVRIFHETISNHSQQLIEGVMTLLNDCPHEAASLRKDILTALKQILQTSIKTKFVEYIPALLDEKVLIGTGWTALETLRPSAYHTLAGMLHNSKTCLPLRDISLAFNVFAKNIDDETLNPQIQALSCKLLMTLSDAQNLFNERDVNSTRDHLLKIVEVYVRKFKVISVFHLPRLEVKHTYPTKNMESQSQADSMGKYPVITNRDERTKLSLQNTILAYNVNDCKNIVKTMVNAIKAIMQNLPSYKCDQLLMPADVKLLHPKETKVFARLFKYALKSFDIYMIQASGPQQNELSHQQTSQQNVRSKDEKETLENFAGIFKKLHPVTFHEIFSQCVEYFIGRMHQNFALQVIVNSFLSEKPPNPPIYSPIFASILLDFLMKRMEDIGSEQEISSLYLRLFKVVFATVSMYPAENEQMLKPYLQDIVRKSMDLALSAKDPFNYFLLLRALFRSIGGGVHDHLYQEFLLFLPSLLQGLNSLQSGLHKQHVKDLIVELCLTIPVRLSNLLKYLPLLMDPLVSAFNGPLSLISQGLRTLELCVDNLQPNFLYEHIQPVQAELMQGLWRTLRNKNEIVAQSSFRILGKLGGGNRKMIREPQSLNYYEQKDSRDKSTELVIHFPDQKVSINLPLDQIIMTAFETIKQPNLFAQPSISNFYLNHSWETIRCHIISTIGLNMDQHQKIKNIFSNPNLHTTHIPKIRKNIYKCTDEDARNIYQTSLTGMFIALARFELRHRVNGFLNDVIRHHIMLSITQLLNNSPTESSVGMDPFVLIDALTQVLSQDDKTLCEPGYYGLAFIYHSAVTFIGSKERACELPMICYLIESMCALCSERAWYTKTGGCNAIGFFAENLPLICILKFQSKFVKSLIYVIRDLTEEISSGAVDLACSNLEKLMDVCHKPLNRSTSEDSNLIALQKKALAEVTELLIREVTSPNQCVRNQSMKLLSRLADLTQVTVTNLVEPHRKVFELMLPLLFSNHRDNQAIEKLPLRSQIGAIRGATFCTSLQPRLLDIDVTLDKHKFYLKQLLKICQSEEKEKLTSEEEVLRRSRRLKRSNPSVSVKIAALYALASCHYIQSYESEIFVALFRSTDSIYDELSREAYICLKSFVNHVKIDLSLVQEEIKPFMDVLQESRNWNYRSVLRMQRITELFPSVFESSFPVKLCEHLTNISASAAEDLKAPLNQDEHIYNRTKSANEKMKICASIIDIIALVDNIDQNFINQLIAIVIKVETLMVQESGSLLRAPLKKLLIRFPEQTMSILLSERNLREGQVYRLVKYILKGDNGEVFRTVLGQPSYYSKLLLLLTSVVSLSEASTNNGQISKPATQYSLRYQAVLIISMLIKYDENWLLSRPQFVEKLQQIWMSDEFHNNHDRVESVDFAQWNEPKLLVKCLLNYLQRQPGNVELLYQLLKVFTTRYLRDFRFLKSFIEETVIKKYTIEWKREAFAKFVSIFYDVNYPQRLKAKILHLIIMPSFAHSFDNGLGEALLGGPPQPERENPTNLIHMFISKVIDPLCGGDKKYSVSDEVRILLLQFSCLLVDQASAHIHEASNRKQSARLTKLVTFAWPCLYNKNCVDPKAKFHGHLLLSHIIAKFAVNKRLIDKVFLSLLKAYAPEARPVVQQAFDILLPALPYKLEDFNIFLMIRTKKILIDEGHQIAQLVHILQLLVRHYKLYYPVRKPLTPQIIHAIQRLSYASNASMEYKRIAIDLCEITIRWEMQRLREVKERVQESNDQPSQPQTSEQASISIKTETPNPSQPQSQAPTIKNNETNDEQITSPPDSADKQPSKTQSAADELMSPKDETVPMETEPVKSVSTNGSEKSVNTTYSFDTNMQQVAELTQAQQAPSPSVYGPPSSAADSINTEHQEKKTVLKSCTDPLDKKYVNSILNTLLRLACHLQPSPNEMPQVVSYNLADISKRCQLSIKTALEIWPGAELDFTQWMDKLLCSVENPQQCSIGNVCMALDLLLHLCITSKREVVAKTFVHLNRGIIACITCNNLRVIKAVSGFIQRLMSVFPTQSSTNQPSEFEDLYVNFYRIIHQGLSNYENPTQPTLPVSLFSALLVLKAACVDNPSYIDRVMPNFIRVLQKMTAEHINQVNQSNNIMTELLILSLDLVKNRLTVLSPELRKQFIQQILSNLIESPSTEGKVLEAITKTVKEWIEQKQNNNQAPNLREKMLLLIKLMLHIEKRLNITRDLKDMEANMRLNALFLELINYVYRNEELKNTELITKLENAFMSGLRCIQPHIRYMFFEVFDQSVKPKLYERLMYIVCAQNWQTIGHHFWIQQCIEFILVIASPELPIQLSNSNAICLPSIHLSSDLGPYNPQDYETPNSLLSMLSDTSPPQNSFQDVEFVVSNDEKNSLDFYINYNSPEDQRYSRKTLTAVINKQSNFYEDIKKSRVGDLLKSIAQLCHSNAELASVVWIKMFPRIWKTLNDQQMTLLGREIIPFLCSGAHVLQKDCQPSAVGVFMEAVALCKPPIQMRPILLKYLGKNHNVWHRAALILEELTKNKNLEVIYPVPAKSNKSHQQNPSEFNIITINQNTTISEESVECLSNILELLREDDLWFGLWMQKANYIETKQAIAYEQQGMFHEAQMMYESAMDRQRKEFDQTCVIKPGMRFENKLWERHWIKCSKELNQWDSLVEYGNIKGCSNPILVLDSAWRVPDWSMMKEALSLVEDNCPYDIAWRVALYKGFNLICNSDDIALPHVDEMSQLASTYCIQTWRKLPHIVSHVHINLLQAAQQVVELNEARQIYASVGPMNMNHGNNIELRAIIKTWRNRLPNLTDDLSHWSDILTWRQHHYQAIMSNFDTHTSLFPHFPQPNVDASIILLGAHSSAQSIIHFGKIARKQGLIDVCLDSINRIHTIPSVPIMDCFQKIKQQIKCYMQMPPTTEKLECLDGLDIIESTNLKYFSKDMVAEFYAIKGMFLSKLDKHEEANKAFSAATSLHDSLPKAWAGWGELMESQFTREFTQVNDINLMNRANFSNRQMKLGVTAVTCYLQACLHLNELKARKYVAKILWLLSFDDERAQLAQQVDKYCQLEGFQAQNWLMWVPQLLPCLLKSGGEYLRNLLILIGDSYPEAVYFPVRTLYFTLKNYIKMRHPTNLQSSPSVRVVQQSQSTPETKTNTGGDVASSSLPLSVAAATQPTLVQQLSQPPVISSPGSTIINPATPQRQLTMHPQPPSLVRCSDIMKKLLDFHPTTLSSLEGIIDQMNWFREYNYEEVQSQMRRALAKCYITAFESSKSIANQTVGPNMISFIRELATKFDVGQYSSSGYTPAAAETMDRNIQAAAQNPEFQQTKVRFRADFDEFSLQSMKLVTLISKLKTWIDILDEKKKSMPKAYYIEDKCRFLSNFSQHTADVELPGEFLMPKHHHYYVRIARFMPKVEVVNKHNASARRIFIRGHDGKIYPYLVISNSCLSDSRREERVLQLFRLLNSYLVKKKETARRFLNFTVPKVVAISPNMRLIEDNPTSLSILNILGRRINHNKTVTTSFDQHSPIAEYYDRLVGIQTNGLEVTPKNLSEILTEVQRNMVPSTLLKDWAAQTYADATSFWAFRSQFTLRVCLSAFVEYAFHLTRLMPDTMFIHQDTGCVNIAYFKFELNKENGELQSERPVPFRLTPNLSELITKYGIHGLFASSMISMARCLTSPSLKVSSLMRAILRDEMLYQRRSQEPAGSQPCPVSEHDLQSEMLIAMVNKAVDKINDRLNKLASNDKPLESKVPSLIKTACETSQLCLMDPAWHPWL